jgi:asparagine synthase (glutamine-hydrolysing)
LNKVALSTEQRLNVKRGSDTFGKHVHRKVAESFGIPRDIAYRIKEAAQHGSGIHGTIDSIARRKGYDEESIPRSYLQILKNREKVGSSQRYGYLFGDEKIWIAEPHVQLYLDNLPSRLPKSEILAEAKNSRKPTV